MSNEVRVLLPEVVLLEGCQYRKIPGYVNAYAGEHGQIVFINSKGDLKKPNLFEYKTTKGSYLYVDIINDDFIKVTKAVHQLVCQTFHGAAPCDGKIYEPNHKNLDKHDNRPSNLEWLTRAQNVQHSYDSGNCQQGLRIELINVQDNSIKKFNSLSTLSRYLGIPRHQLRIIAAKHRDIPYDGLYKFIVDDSSDRKLGRHQSRAIIYKDYRDGSIHICQTALDAAERTNVNSASILLRSSSRCSPGTKNKLLSCYVFKDFQDYSDNPTPWPNFDKEEALKEKSKYENKDK